MLGGGFREEHAGEPDLRLERHDASVEFKSSHEVAAAAGGDMIQFGLNEIDYGATDVGAGAEEMHRRRE